ncbi:MAG: protein-L-isoaspartate(D-aspartate) O-methyltransferase [Planctomycetota bacterium]|jgi:protein-L-isoaspartate(D-aspartate) O-methyltransferase
MKDDFADSRDRMIRFDLQGRGITDKVLLEAMASIPRQNFIDEKYWFQAYSDGPLPIGHGQTISQPYIVALMTQELKVNANCSVLEIGTGSGYQTAILARLAKKVYTIERFSELTDSAKVVLDRLGFGNIKYFVGDGTCGWPQKQTFDRIIITAAAPKIPQPLIEQLSEDGLIVIPIGPVFAQQLVVAEKKKNIITEKIICDVRFVRLMGKYGFSQ